MKPDSKEAHDVSEILLKEVNKKRYTASQVVMHMKEKGYPKFLMHHHINLWKRLEAKDPTKGYGCKGDYKNTWVWFDKWIARVLEHCKESVDEYT